MKLTWTARARTRLAELHDYIAQDSKTRALAMVERILDRAETLLVAPRSGVRLKAFVDDEVRELLERPYRIIYRIQGLNEWFRADGLAAPGPIAAVIVHTKTHVSTVELNIIVLMWRS